MTLDELKTKMESLGFRFQQSSDNGGPVGLFFRRIPEVKRECLTNEGKLQFAVELWDRYRITRIDDKDRFGLDADITGEYTNDLWAKLRVYGVRPEVFFEKHKEIETALVRAWEALA
jgi:hypothetical protein